MAGHSKWANIKHRKSKQDAKKGKLYTKLIREITVSAKLSGPDADANPRLRAAIDEALGANMSKDVIDRAIKRGAGGMEGEEVEEIRYEGYAPGGVAIVVDCMTNNRNRTVADVRHAFTKCGGNLGTDGSVAYLFTKLGQFLFAPGIDEERIMNLALEIGADDIVINQDKSVELTTTPETFLTIKQAIQQNGFDIAQSEITMIAKVSIPVTDKDAADKIMRLIDMLDDLDDVQHVYSNADIVEEVMSQLE